MTFTKAVDLTVQNGIYVLGMVTWRSRRSLIFSLFYLFILIIIIIICQKSILQRKTYSAADDVKFQALIAEVTCIKDMLVHLTEKIDSMTSCQCIKTSTILTG